MALWLVRAGKYGQAEQHFLEHSRILLTWGDLASDLRGISSREGVKPLVRDLMPTASEGKVSNGAGQVWGFVSMEPGDWFVLPSKLKRAIHVGEITGDLQFDEIDGIPTNFRPVRWIQTDIPRSNFDQDLLYSFGAFMTVCRITRNDAESRIKAMARYGWQARRPGQLAAMPSDSVDTDDTGVDIEAMARDQIARLIIAQFKGHGLAKLVDALLRAQGYTTYMSPEGPDKGIDILAAPGPLGFGEPRLCVQVKSGSGPLDRPTLDQLIGTMQNVQAKQGLSVSWGGFKSSVEKEEVQQFFRVRLWDQDELIDQVLAHYDKLDEDLRTDLPLKRIWTVAEPEENAAL